MTIHNSRVTRIKKLWQPFTLCDVPVTASVLAMRLRVGRGMVRNVGSALSTSELNALRSVVNRPDCPLPHDQRVLLISKGLLCATPDGLAVTLAGQQRILEDLEEASTSRNDDDPELELVNVADELIQFTGLPIEPPETAFASPVAASPIPSIVRPVR